MGRVDGSAGGSGLGSERRDIAVSPSTLLERGKSLPQERRAVNAKIPNYIPEKADTGAPCRYNAFAKALSKQGEFAMADGLENEEFKPDRQIVVTDQMVEAGLFCLRGLVGPDRLAGASCDEEELVRELLRSALLGEAQ